MLALLLSSFLPTAHAADAEPQDAFMYFTPVGYVEAKTKATILIESMGSCVRTTYVGNVTLKRGLIASSSDGSQHLVGVNADLVLVDSDGTVGQIADAALAGGACDANGRPSPVPASANDVDLLWSMSDAEFAAVAKRWDAILIVDQEPAAGDQHLGIVVGYDHAGW